MAAPPDADLSISPPRRPDPLTPHRAASARELSAELEEWLAILVRAVFATSIDPALPQGERWRISVRARSEAAERRQIQ